LVVQEYEFDLEVTASAEADGEDGEEEDAMEQD
jgi:hypothetical protein